MFNEKNKPVIAVSFNSSISDKQSIQIKDNFIVKRANLENITGEKSTSVFAKSKNTHYITIDKKDLLDLTKAWEVELSKQKGIIFGKNIFF